MKQFLYQFPFQLRDEVSQMDRVNEWLANESEKRMDFLSSSEKPFLTVDGTKAIDDAITHLSWQLKDLKSGSVSLFTNRELTPVEVSGLPFQLIDRSNNIAASFNWSHQPGLRFVFDEDVSLEMKTDAAEQGPKVPSLGDALNNLKTELDQGESL